MTLTTMMTRETSWSRVCSYLDNIDEDKSEANDTVVEGGER